MSQIHELIPKIMAEVGAISKNRENVSQRFFFRGIEDVYKHLQLLLAKHGVSAFPSVLTVERETRKTAKGGDMLSTLLTVRYTFFAPDGSSVEAVAAGEGMDSGDKATSKAMSIAHKNCLLQVFMVPTEDAVDPDKDAPRIEATVTNDQLGVLRDMMASTNTEEEAFCKFLKVAVLEDLFEAHYANAMSALNAKAKKMSEGAA